MLYEKRFHDFLNKELVSLVRAGYWVVLSLTDPEALGVYYIKRKRRSRISKSS